MLLKPKPTAPVIAPDAPAVTTQLTPEHTLTTTGSIIPSSGLVNISSLPPHLVSLINNMEVQELEIKDDYKKILDTMKKSTEIAVMASAIDPAALQPKKITSMSQLSAEDRAAVSSLLAQAPVIAPPKRENNKDYRSFSSVSELIEHANKQVQGLNAVTAVIQEEGEKPVPVQPIQVPHTSPEPQVQPVPTVAPVPTPKAAQNLKRCPHCDMSLLVAAAEFTDKQKEDFVVAVVSNQPYTETLPFFGGNVQAKFKALTTLEQDAIESAVENVNKRTDISAADRFAFYTRSYLAVALTELTLGETPHRFTDVAISDVADETVNAILLRCQALLTLIPNGELFRLLANEAVKFQFKVRQLAAKGLNADFWQPIQS